MQATKHASEGSTLALKPREDITRNPKQGYQWPHEKDLCPPKTFPKKKDLVWHSVQSRSLMNATHLHLLLMSNCRSHVVFKA